MSGFLANKSLLSPTVTQYSGGTASFTLPQSGSTNSTQVLVGGVEQVPGVDFTVSGTGLTLTTSAPAGANMVCARQYFADGIVNTPADNSVATAKIAADAITGAKIADDALDSEHYAAASVDGAHISNDAIDSQHYVDGSIGAAHLSDDAVSLAKMASGTDGQIITYDASGNPTAVGPGTDGQVLTSTGAGSPPAFEDAGGGAWEVVSTAVASSSSTVEITGIDSSADTWCINIEGANISGSNVFPKMRTSNDTSSHSYDSGASDYGWAYFGTHYGYYYDNHDATGDNEIEMGSDPFLLSSNADNAFSGRILIHDPSDTTYQTALSFMWWFYNGQDHPQFMTGTAVRFAAEAVTAVQFYMSSGNFDTGRFTLLKCKHSQDKKWRIT